MGALAPPKKNLAAPGTPKNINKLQIITMLADPGPPKNMNKLQIWRTRAPPGTYMYDAYKYSALIFTR